MFFSLILPPPPKSPLFPYTTLFRSVISASLRYFSRGEFASGNCTGDPGAANAPRSEEHTSELQSHSDLVCRLLLEKKNAFSIHLLWVRQEPEAAIGVMGGSGLTKTR